MSLRIILFFGSVREGRNCTRVGNFIKKQIEERHHHVTVFDPLMMEFPLLKKPLHFHAPNEKPPEWLVKYNEVIEKADGFVVVSGEYNRCIPPALANMLDHFPPKSYRCKPCSIVCYSAGPGGGSTAGMQLRYFLGELGMVTPGFLFTIPVVHQAFSEDGTPSSSNDTALSKAARLVSELEWDRLDSKLQPLSLCREHHPTVRSTGKFSAMAIFTRLLVNSLLVFPHLYRNTLRF